MSLPSHVTQSINIYIYIYIYLWYNTYEYICTYTCNYRSLPHYFFMANKVNYVSYCMSRMLVSYCMCNKYTFPIEIHQ
jgi:hypothetical protein